MTRSKKTAGPQKRLVNGIVCLFSLLALMAASVGPEINPAHAQQPPTNGINGNGSQERFVSIDFNDVDISVFIKFISELTGKNFIVDNRVKGKVTVISPAKISVEEAFNVFVSVLEVHGFTTVDSGNVIKIVSAPEARAKSIRTLLDRERVSPEDKVVTQVISLRYADPNDITRLFRPLVSKSSVILPYQPTNMLIITDVYSNIRRLMKILASLDVPGVGQEIGIIPLNYADAANVVRVLSTVFQQRRAAQKGAAPGETVRFVADERTNTIIALANEEELVRIRELVNRIDLEVPRGKEKIHVYYLENATAEELAKVLQSLSSKVKPTTAQKGKKEAPIVSEKTNITADKATNSLIIMADKDDYLTLEAIIKKLDIPRSMVYIECLIMEVNVSNGFSLGVEWIAMGDTEYRDSEAAFGGGFSGGESGYDNLAGLITPPMGMLPPGFSLGIFAEPLQIGDLTFPNLGAIVQAFRKNKDVHILSTPQILTTDNEEATITVGKNVPYLTKSGSSTVESYNTYEYKDVGITLKITPQISKDKTVRLQIAQEVTKLDQTLTTGDRPTTLKRTIDTTVIVHDKNTVVIGGLIDDSLSTTEYKIPCLGDVPGLGWLFKSLSNSQEKTNLFVFLTPHVMQNAAEAEAFYNEKKQEVNRIEEQGIKLYERHYDKFGYGRSDREVIETPEGFPPGVAEPEVDIPSSPDRVEPVVIPDPIIIEDMEVREEAE